MFEKYNEIIRDTVEKLFGGEREYEEKSLRRIYCTHNSGHDGWHNKLISDLAGGFLT